MDPGLKPVTEKLVTGFLFIKQVPRNQKEIAMTEKIEVRVRPVQRHLVTVWVEGAGSRLIGEFESPTIADEVAAALQAKTPGAMVVNSEGAVTPGAQLEYVIVAAHMHEVENLAYFAYSEAEAERAKAEAEDRHGAEFRIYCRVKTGG